ncbi:P protein [Halotydeus destructor]|nr:P protein [Halotydeus destructor]
MSVDRNYNLPRTGSRTLSPPSGRRRASSSASVSAEDPVIGHRPRVLPELRRLQSCYSPSCYRTNSPKPRGDDFEITSLKREPHSSRISRSRAQSRSNLALNERTPLIGNGRGIESCYVPINVLNGDLKSIANSEDEEEDGEYVQTDYPSEWTFARLLKSVLLSLVVVYTLAAFICFPEKHEKWTNVAVRKGDPVYLNLTEQLDIINPVWTVKAKASFLPKEYNNLSQYGVRFTIVRYKEGIEIGRFRQPWTVPVASNNMSRRIPLKTVEHSFIMPGVLNGNDADYSPIDEFIEDLFDDENTFQLEITTNEEFVVPISLSVTAFSDLSLKGILMAGGVLIFLYVLIIFEVVHRTLAAMIGAVAALACMALIHDRPSIERVVSWLDTETLALLFGMMIMVAILCETGFFDYVAVLAFKLARGRTMPMVVILCLFTAFLSAFLDNVTTILLMTPVTIRLCEIKNIDPKHVLIAQVIFSNIGGAATPIGDPPNVIIINSHKVQELGVDFSVFCMHLLPGILLCVALAVAYFLFMYRDLTKLSFQEPPNQVGKKRLMEYLRDEVNFLDSMEKKDIGRDEKSLASKRGSRYQENIQLRPSSDSSQPSTLKPSITTQGATSPDTVFEGSTVCPKSIELQAEIDVWKKACQSIPRDENSVRTVLNRKVMALENVLRKHLYDDVRREQEDDFEETLAELTRKYRIKNKPLLVKSSIVMFGVILLFFLQSLPNMSLSLGWIAILGAVALMTLSDSQELESIINRVEWSTLIFFASLFIVMEVLEELRFLSWIGQLTESAINSFSDENKLLAAIIIILWVSALSSSLIDNIPFATVMIKIVEDLAESDSIDLPITPLIYALAFGACLGGNGTLIGASANVVCAGVAEQHGYRFTFIDFFKIGFPIMLLTTAVANIYLIFCHILFAWH